jgi:DNA-directed RNA polymerase specialized sigma24 family protein
MLPEHEYERRESEQVVQQALDRLEPNQRAVVVLVELQNSAPARKPRKY